MKNSLIWFYYKKNYMSLLYEFDQENLEQNEAEKALNEYQPTIN